MILITEPVLNFYPRHSSAYIFHAFYSKDVYKYYIFLFIIKNELFQFNINIEQNNKN